MRPSRERTSSTAHCHPFPLGESAFAFPDCAFRATGSAYAKVHDCMSSPDSPTSSVSTKFPTLARLSPSIGRWAFRCSLLGFGLVLLYALSIGPAVLLNRRGVL